MTLNQDVVVAFAVAFAAVQQKFKVSTEAIDATVNLDGVKRSNYDPDEMMEEQRERGMRKRRNNAFKDFASKVCVSATSTAATTPTLVLLCAAVFVLVALLRCSLLRVCRSSKHVG